MIRLYEHADLHAAARVWFDAGIQAYPYLPDFQALTPTRAEQVFAEVIAARGELWVYELKGKICGFIALQGTYIDRLYVDPAQQGKGIGSALLNHAKSTHPDYLSLHTHQANHDARIFYERAGFTVHKLGMSPAPENVPDVEYRWTGESSEFQRKDTLS
ncbi:MAG: GNAT family N-acetyltransferase [Pseudomonadaceae bacterium]|nr:GNAT family N-acetyltransferase [Pseudomonadaceae bacterium]